MIVTLNDFVVDIVEIMPDQATARYDSETDRVEVEPYTLRQALPLQTEAGELGLRIERLRVRIAPSALRQLYALLPPETVH